MSDYFERIEAHLLDAVERNAKSAARLRHLRRIARGKWPSRRPLLVAGSTASIGVTVLVALALSAGTGQPAYALVVRPDGTLALTLNEIIGAGPANARLAQLGVRARLVGRTAGCSPQAEPVSWTVVDHHVKLGQVHGHTTGKPTSSTQTRRVAERLAASKEAMQVIRGMIEKQKTARGVRMIIHPSAIPHGLILMLALKPVPSVHDTHGTHKRPLIGVSGSIALYRDPVPGC